MISTSLRAVVSQQLLRTADGKGRCAAHEIMLWNPAVAVAIRSGSVSKLNQAIQTGQKMGMTTMDDSLMRYLKEGRVKPIDAYMKAFDKKLFAPLLKPGELPEG